MIYSIDYALKEGGINMKKIKAILERLHPEIDFTANDKLIEGRILDSFDILSLVSELNEAYDIKIKAADIRPENFNTLAAIEALVSRLLEE